ncbi:MAG: dipeptide ABC transporter ATP-binding protein DppD, partial [Rubrivivax sp.]|nr:dipeptide ABC transporter ATP-binding protein DppD [Rubrivivax sp.]
AMPERSAGQARLASIPGVVPGLHDRPRGCLFAPRCADATRLACGVRPALRGWQDGGVRCHYPLGDAQRDAARAGDQVLDEATP